jgi:hypothetical protein
LPRTVSVAIEIRCEGTLVKCKISRMVSDFFQLSTAYDYFQDVSFHSEFNHYGLGVRDAYDQLSNIPEPSTYLLVGTGLLGLLGYFWRRKLNG